MKSYRISDYTLDAEERWPNLEKRLRFIPDKSQDRVHGAMGVSAYELAKALSFPGIYEVVRGDRAIRADTAVRLGKYFGLPAQFWAQSSERLRLRTRK